MNLPTTPFDELTTDQLHELTPEAIDRYIDIACAIAGVPLLPATPPEPPIIRAVSRSVVHYLIEDTTLRLSDEGAANRIADAINREAEYRRTLETIGDRYRYGKPAFDTKATDVNAHVTIERVFNRQECEEQDTIETRTADAKSAFDTAKKEYDKTYEKRSAIASDIYGRIAAAHTTISRRERIRHEHARYLELAGGNEVIAARFLVKAYGEDARLIGIFIEELEAAHAVDNAEPAGNEVEL